MHKPEQPPAQTGADAIINNPEVREHLEKLRAIYIIQMGLPRPALGGKGKPSKQAGKKRGPKKVSITLRVSPDVLAAFRATGRGWQTRMDEALREAMDMQKR